MKRAARPRPAPPSTTGRQQGRTAGAVARHACHEPSRACPGARTPRLRGAPGLVLLLALLGCHRQQPPRDELVVLIEQPPRNIDPRYTLSSHDFKLSYLCFARLVSVDDPKLEPHLELAERIDELPREGQGPLRYDITLREARFSDGTPVGAEDVVYTFKSLLDEKTGSSILRRRFQDAGLVTPLQVLGPRTVRLTLLHPHASLRTDLDFGILRRGSIEAGRLVGAGAFVLEGEVGEVSRFVRNQHYYGGPPPIRRLTVRVVRDANSRLLSLVGGSADLTQNTVSALLFPAIERWQDRLSMQTAPSAIALYVGMNLTDPHLRDVRVRQALALAIDRERIVKAKLYGKAVLASSLLPTFHWAYTGDVAGYPHDLARAARLLDEAGFPDPDGPGPRPRFTLSYKTSTDALPVSIARVVAAQLGEIGVEVEVRPYEFNVFLSDVKKGNFQLFALSTGEFAEPNLYKRYFHSKFVPTPQNPDAGQNRMRYVDPEMDRLLDAGEREVSRPERRRIYAQVQRMLARDLPVIPMWHVDNVVVMRRQVHDYVVLPSAQLTGLSRVWKD